MATGIARTASQRMDSYGDEREAGGIEEDVDDRPQIIVHSTEPESHLQHILYRQSYQGSTIIHRERSYRLFSHLTCR